MKDKYIDRYWEREAMTHDQLWIKNISCSMICSGTSI